MNQTVKYAKTRAQQDPDRENSEYSRAGVGVYSGSNVTTHQRRSDATHRERCTHGSCG